MGAVYRQLNEKMELLWTKDLKMNTVHVLDAARGIWHVTATKEQGGGRNGPVKPGEVWNLADRSDTGKRGYHF